MPRFKFVVHKSKAPAQNGKKHKHKQKQKHYRRAVADNDIGNLLDKHDDDDKQTRDDDLRNNDIDERSSNNNNDNSSSCNRNSNNGPGDFWSKEQHMLLATAALPNLSPAYFSASSRTTRTGRSSSTMAAIGRTYTNSSKYRDLLVPSFSSYDEEQEQNGGGGSETKAQANGLGLPNEDNDRGNQCQSIISPNHGRYDRLFSSISQQSSASCYSSSFGYYYDKDYDDETIGVSTEWVTHIDYQPRTGGVKKPETTIIRTPAGGKKENKEEGEKERREQPEQDQTVDNDDASAFEISNDGKEKDIDGISDSGDDNLKCDLETAHLYYDTKSAMAPSKTMSTTESSSDLSSSLLNGKRAQEESPVAATAAPASLSFLTRVANTLWVCSDNDNYDDNPIIKCGRGGEPSDETTLGETAQKKTKDDKEWTELPPTTCMGAVVDDHCDDDDSNDESHDSNDDDSSDSDDYDEYTSGSTTAGDDTETNASTTLGDYSENLTDNYTTTGDSYTRTSTVGFNDDEDDGEDDGEDGTTISYQRGSFSASTIGDEETLATYTDIGLASTMGDASVIGDPTSLTFNVYGEEDDDNDVGDDDNDDCDDKDNDRDDQRDNDNCISNSNDEGCSANNNSSISSSSSINNNGDNNSSYGSQKSFRSPLSDSYRTTSSNCR